MSTQWKHNIWTTFPAIWQNSRNTDLTVVDHASLLIPKQLIFCALATLLNCTVYNDVAEAKRKGYIYCFWVRIMTPCTSNIEFLVMQTFIPNVAMQRSNDFLVPLIVRCKTLTVMNPMRTDRRTSVFNGCMVFSELVFLRNKRVMVNSFWRPAPSFGSTKYYTHGSTMTCRCNGVWEKQ